MGKKIALVIVRLAVSAGIIIYIFSKPDTSLPRIFAALKHIKLSWLLSALITCKAAILIGSYRWQILMKAHDIKVNYRQAVGLNYLGAFFNNFMLSLTGGDVVKAYYAAKLTSEKKAESATVVFIDRLIGFSGLLILGLVSVLFGIGKEGVSSALVVILVAVLCFAILGIFAFNRGIARKFAKFTGSGGIRETLKKVYDAVYFYKSKKGVLAKAFALSILVWIFLVLINFQLAKGLGIELSAGYYFVFIPVINIISSMPITIAGWGLREQMYKQFFGSVGVSGGTAVSLSIAFAMVMLALSLIGGVLYALRLPKFTGDKKLNPKRVIAQ